MSLLSCGLRRAVVCLLSGVIAQLVLLPLHSAAAQPLSPSSSALPEGYASRILAPQWRAAFPSRAAFGSLCSLGPLACALIDRPFAFNARLDLVIRPKAPDGSTGVLLPFAVSVPLFGRAEVGLGSCYAGFWGSKEDAAKANADPSIKRPSGLCPFWLAAKLLIFPWFRDPHKHPALAAEYQFEYQAGPFSGLNQLGLPGHLSKLSLAYRHPFGRLELGAAVSVLIDHTTRAGTLQFGPHVGYRLPIGEHFWFFGQAMVQAPSWGPIILGDMPGQTLNLASPVAGTLAVGAQQRADFGFGAGLTLMLTKSDIDTRVDFLFRLLSFELGPHIKPLIPARQKRDEAPKVAVAVNPQAAPQLECPAGYKVELPPQVPAPVAAAPQNAIPNPAPVEPKCVPIPPAYRIPSPRWGQPCYLAPFDGSAALRMGNIDSTGQYCEWDGLRLPLGAVIDPPQRVPHSELGRPQGPLPAPQSFPSGAALAHAPPTYPRASTRRPTTAARAKHPAVVMAMPPDSQQLKPSSPPAPRGARSEHATGQALSIPGSPFASGFSDRADEMYKHGRDLYRVIKQHGPGVVIPSREEAEAWLRDVKEECLDRLDECLKDKAKEAAEALNDFQKKPWDEKKYIAGGWAFGAVEAVIETAALPGAGVAAGGAAKAGERAAAKGAVKQVEKEAVAAAEHAGEAAAKKAAKEAAEAEAKRIAEAEAKREVQARLEHEAKERAEREAKARAEREARQRAAQKAEEEFVEHAPNFDAARKKAFERSGMTDPQHIEFTKVDPTTGTVVEFKGPGGAKVAYDPPHASPGPGHDKPHVGWQTSGKRGSGGAQRGNITYDGPQHPHRSSQKGQGDIVPRE